MDDTSPEIAEKMREMMRSKSPVERYKMGWSMYETSKFLVTRAILENNPNISEVRLRQELFLKFYGSDFDLAEQQKILSHLSKIK